jgi:hypothetical protein
LYLSNGQLQYDGTVAEAASHYFKEVEFKSTLLSDFNEREGNGKVRLTSIDILSKHPLEINQDLKLLLKLNQPIEKSRLILSFTLRDFDHQMLSYFVSDETQIKNENQNQTLTDTVEIVIRHFTFRPGKYNVRIMLHDGDTSAENTCDIIESALELEVMGNDFFQSGKPLRLHDPTAILDAYFIYK